jgi:O-antigen/teichoic acid export membrane protein
MTGTVVAQIIGYAVYPLITRIYSPEDMGELGLFSRFVPFIATFATVRYEFALPLAKHDHHAFGLFRLSLRIAFVCLFSVLIFGMCYAIFQPEQKEYFVFILMSVGSAYATVWISLGTNWAIRKKEFRLISQQRVVNALGVNGLRLVFGYLKLGSLGLLLGTFLFFRKFFHLKKEHKPVSRNKRMNALAKEYKSFPSTNLPHALLDLGVDSIIAWSIVEYFDKAEFGQYSLAFLVMKIPLSVIGSSIGQVFFNRVSEMANLGRSAIPLILKTTRTLLLLCVVPFTLIFIFGEEIFTFVFGKKWTMAGTFGELLVPYLFFNFMISPLSTLPIIYGRQKEALFLGITVAVVQLTCFLVIPHFYPKVSLYNIVLWNSLAMAVVLVGVFFVYLQFAKKGRING